MRKIIQSLPGPRIIIVIFVASLLLGALITGGFHAKALLGLLFGAAFLLLMTIQNYNPDAHEAWHNPRAYSYRRQRDQLLLALEVLTTAVETDSQISNSSSTAAQAVHARRILNEIAGA